MNWIQFTQTKRYYLLPLASWWGVGFLMIYLSWINKFDYIDILFISIMFIGGIVVSLHFHTRQKEIRESLK